MDQAMTRRIAERFGALSPEQRRAVYQKIGAEGMSMAQFPVLPRTAQARSPASYAQMRLWFLWQLEPTSTAYHMAGALRLKGELNLPALRASFAALVQRHEALRTMFAAAADGSAEQIIPASLALDIPLLQATDAAHAMALVQQLTSAPFDLTQGPLLRVAVIAEAPGQHVLVVVKHHIISDGWSMQLLVDEFVAQYRARVTGAVADLAALPVQYADYAVWQRHWLEAGEKERQLAWWLQQLGGPQPVLQLPSDHPRNATGEYLAAHAGLTLPTDLAQALQQRAQASGHTLFMLLLAGFQVWLHRYSGQADIRVGVPVANRHRVETEGVLGFFVNTQVLRSQLHGRMSLHDALAQTRAAALGAQSHQDLPFEQLVEALQPERGPGVAPLFQVMFNHLRGDMRALEQLPGLTLEPCPAGAQAAQFELTLNTHERPDGSIDLGFSYAAALFDASTVARWLQQYQQVLRALLDQPERAIGDLPLLAAAEHKQLQQWAVNPTVLPAAQAIHTRVEWHAATQADAPAIMSDGHTLSYAGLNQRANQIAHRLLALGVRPEMKIGVTVARSPALVAGLLAILKAGAAYVPLDPDYPAERLRYMAADSGIELLLANAPQNSALADAGLPVLLLDDASLANEPTHNPALAVAAEQLAYVIYTSGSTGQPKGVAVTHGGIHRLVAQAGYAQLDTSTRMLQLAPLAFDASTLEIWGSLAQGGVLIQAGPIDFVALADLLLVQRVNTAWLTAALFNQMLESQPQALAGLRQVLTGGEAMSPHHARIALAAGIPLINGYGPTECTTFAACHPVAVADLAGNGIPLGQPVSGTQCLVLDVDLQPVAQGAVGELYLGGAGLARGYLGRAALTAERFVAHPAGNGERLYRTGDLVRWNNAGQLEYLGRIDHQVKIRGFRIELGEIETCLLAMPGVSAAAVLARMGAAGARLVAYVVPQAGCVLESGAVRSALAQQLPDYMLPGAVVVLDALPLNANGKVDRHALADPALPVQGYVAPVGSAEQALAALWAEVLGVDRVGRHDHFFELGGHSLLALRVVALAQARDLPGFRLQDLMRRPTVAGLLGADVGSGLPAALSLLNQARAEIAPLFCIHPGLGTVLEYLPLARQLNGLRAVYGLACRTLTDLAHRDVSLPQMARDYVGMVRAVQPQGPYYLLGWSLGGALASMMAAELEAAGERVAFLGLVDAYVPTVHDVAVGEWRDELGLLLRSMSGVMPPQVPVDLVDPMRDGSGLLAWVGGLLASGEWCVAAQYEGISAEEVLRFFVTIQALGVARGAEVGVLPEVAVAAHCWWSQAQPEAAIVALKRQLRQAAVWHKSVDADHFSIVSDGGVVADVVGLVGG